MINFNGQEIMIGFTSGIRLGIKRWNDYQGRSSRSEFWWFHLFAVLFFVAVLLIMNKSGFPTDTKYGISLLVILVILVPITTLNVRRLHDIGFSGWRLPFILFPLFGQIFLLFYGNKKGDNGANRFGTEPEINYFFHGVARYSDFGEEFDNDEDYSNLTEEEIFEKRRIESIKRLQKSKNLLDLENK